MGNDNNDIWKDPPVSYWDDGVRFGTGWEMIAEIKRLRAALTECIKTLEIEMTLPAYGKPERISTEKFNAHAQVQRWRQLLAIAAKDQVTP